MSHNRSHVITGVSDHSAGNWKIFHSNGSGEVVELALDATVGKALVSDGATSAPTWSGVVMQGPVTCAGATPVDSDVSAWANDSYGICVGTGGRVWAAFKNSTDVYYVELTAL